MNNKNQLPRVLAPISGAASRVRTSGTTMNRMMNIGMKMIMGAPSTLFLGVVQHSERSP